MKKTIIFLLLAACLLGLVACDPAAIRIDRDTINSNTVRIDLVQYENERPETLRTDGKTKPIFDFSKVTLLETLDASRIWDVVTDIAQQDLLVYNKVLNEPIGKTLILYQKDGTMLVLFGGTWQDGKGNTKYYGQCSMFDESGAFVKYLGDISSDYVDALASRYFGYPR